jgi:hypothetical protein
MRTVAALCVSGRSIYRHMPGVVAFDQYRDARTFLGGMPVVAHPPCRCWSKYLSHQAKPKDRAGEMALGLWCVDQVIRYGGVLEHPAGSRLFEVADLPLPGDFADPFLYTVYVEQSWFGFPTRKPTWVLVSGVPPADLAPFPFSLDSSSRGLAGGFWKEMYSRTLPDFAVWLVETARGTWHSLPVRSWDLALAVRPGLLAPALAAIDLAKEAA